MQKWEYKVIGNPANNEREKQRLLDSRGTEGWELICIDSGWYIFKRPILPVDPIDVITDEDGIRLEWSAP